MKLLAQEEIQDLRDHIAQGDKLDQMWQSLVQRVEKQTSSLKLVQPGDTVEWWHLAWERISDAAFVYAINRDEGVGEWLKHIVLEMIERPGTDWHGPAFRGRATPQYGVLETTHVGVAVAEACWLCSDLFSDSERTLILEKVKEECQEPCRRSLNDMSNKRGNMSNWFMVLLNGFGTSSILLDDREAVLEAIGYYQTAVRMFNGDSYGESLQYWNYAAHHLSNFQEMLTRYDAELAEQTDFMCYARCIPWAVQSLMYMKPLENSKKIMPRSLNFGDSAAIFRPSANLLLQVAKRAKEVSPQLAGLARWLFEETYSVLELERNELATFGFVNSFQYMSLLHYAGAAAPLSPEEAGLPLVQEFETGNVIVRDGWLNKGAVLGMQAGYEVLQVTSHNHMDQGSFILAHHHERFFIDPGHACYRLETQSKSMATSSHNTWTFQVEGQIEPLVQQTIEGVNFWNPRESLVNRKVVSSMDGITVVRCNLAPIYGRPILNAERTWVTSFPNMMMIIDRISTDVPVKTQTHFLLNNRGNKLLTNLYSDTKIVLRRGEAATKFFLMDTLSGNKSSSCARKLSWGFMHDYYHPLPNQDGQGKEGSAVRVTYENNEFAKEHVMVYAFAMDDIDSIRGWHIYNPAPNVYFAESPNKDGGLSVEVEPDGGLIIQDYGNGRIYGLLDGEIVLKDDGTQRSQ
ncbi:hypothetical protein FHS19_000066 [Paenibacillus rhizosphaerae]|uniref:Heparinase II/III-like C-terminal domain-containing protein n=1 Tax=Paenibacillus rhizosphaerae TaxID=297318 RepID=A0A839TFP2_9BACL|nr:heparinase II/III family protein [Paenibacillus rhizosphaerae]MBB3125412.1 hypothetical protein [Paenibacillus rhizosphaerae]